MYKVTTAGNAARLLYNYPYMPWIIGAERLLRFDQFVHLVILDVVCTLELIYWSSSFSFFGPCDLKNLCRVDKAMSPYHARVIAFIRDYPDRALSMTAECGWIEKVRGAETRLFIDN